MLAQFSIWTLDDPNMSDDIAQVEEMLGEFNVHHKVGPMATTVEGEWDQVMAAIEACHRAVRRRHQRVLTTITLDDDAP